MRVNIAKKPNPPSDKKYRHFIGKYIRYPYEGGYRCAKITGIKLQTDTMHDYAKTGRKGNFHFFNIEGEDSMHWLAHRFGCKRTKRRLARGEYQLIDTKDVESVRKLDMIN